MKKPNRYLCLFRHIEKDYFIIHLSFATIPEAQTYIEKVVRLLPAAAEAQVLDDKTNQIVGTASK